MNVRMISRAVALAAVVCPALAALSAPIPTNINKIVLVIEENRSYSEVINPAVPLGSTPAPYLNSLARNGANFTNATEVVASPSQPNYIAFFGGKYQNLTTNDVTAPTISIVDNNRYTTVASRLITNQSLGGQLIAAGKGFVGLSESLPSDGSDVDVSGAYARKHNPFTQFQDTAGSTYNRVYNTSTFPITAGTDYSFLPKLTMIVPNNTSNSHDSNVATMDTWLQTNMNAYATWAQANNSLLIVAFDEGNTSSSDPLVPMVMYGPMVQPGNYSDAVNNYGLLRTIEDMNGLSYLGNASTATSISSVWIPEPSTGMMMLSGLGALALRRRRVPNG